MIGDNYKYKWQCPLTIMVWQGHLFDEVRFAGLEFSGAIGRVKPTYKLTPKEPETWYIGREPPDRITAQSSGRSFDKGRGIIWHESRYRDTIVPWKEWPAMMTLLQSTLWVEMYWKGILRQRLSQWYKLSDATKLWKLNESTLRKAISYGRFINGVDVCKFGKQWIVSMDAMKREYGDIINWIPKGA